MSPRVAIAGVIHQPGAPARRTSRIRSTDPIQMALLTDGWTVPVDPGSQLHVGGELEAVERLEGDLVGRSLFPATDQTLLATEPMVQLPVETKRTPVGPIDSLPEPRTSGFDAVGIRGRRPMARFAKALLHYATGAFAKCGGCGT